MIPQSRIMTRPGLAPPVQALYDQIGPLAFARMKASNLIVDKRKNALQWKTKGSQFTSIRVECRHDGNGYQISFFIINRQQFTEIVIEQVEAKELTHAIERITGLRLSEVTSAHFV